MKTCIKCHNKFLGDSILTALCKKCYFDKLRIKKAKITNKKKLNKKAVKNYQYASCYMCRKEYYGDEKIHCCNNCKSLLKTLSTSSPTVMCEICHDNFISLDNAYVQCGRCACGDDDDYSSYDNRSYSSHASSDELF